MKRAVFLDRDGVLNRIIYHREIGVIDSPFTARQLSLLPGAARAVRRLNRLGLEAVLVSNQPGIAKGNFTPAALREMTAKLTGLLAAGGARLDAIYYCIHHPAGRLSRYRVRCSCRKPKPGLLRRAGRERGIDLRKSYMIGDSISDIEAGRAAGCTTILLGSSKCDACRFMQARGVRPHHLAPDLPAAVRIIQELITHPKREDDH